MIRVAHRRVKVKDRVVGTARSDPFVHRLAFCFAGLGEIEGSLEGSQRATVDLQVAGVRALDQPPMTSDDVGHGWRLRVECHPDVVDRLEHDHVCHARLEENVAVKTRGSTGTKAGQRVGRRVWVAGRLGVSSQETTEIHVVTPRHDCPRSRR